VTAWQPFQVRVEGVRFAAAHFATFAGSCEPLHGHSYEVAAEIEGPLTEDSWVVDFTLVKSALRRLCSELDHRFLLQTQSRSLQVSGSEGSWQVQTPAGAAYTFPRQDVVALPIDNSTAERLAEWLCGRLWQALIEKGGESLLAVTVEVWEGPGQRASFRRDRLSLA
jgi:6-pyruvoyltetrahydropterin/6-carboxytetrahydropterin synthase